MATSVLPQRTNEEVDRPTALTASSATATQSGDISSAATSAEYIVTGLSDHKIVVALVIILLGVGVALLSWYLHARNSEVAIESIAVLPLQNRSAEPDTEYLSDGLTESLIYRLSQLPNLKVSPTSSVFQYKGKEVDPVKVGNQRPPAAHE